MAFTTFFPLANNRSKHYRQTPDNKNTFLVDIKGLPKERVLFALFNNVHNRSEAACNTLEAIKRDMKGCNSSIIKDDSSFSEEKAKEILSNEPRQYIRYIGSVKIEIDFSNDTINTHEYDHWHKTNSNSSLLRAKECIEELRLTIEQEKHALLGKLPLSSQNTPAKRGV